MMLQLESQAAEQLTTSPAPWAMQSRTQELTVGFAVAGARVRGAGAGALRGGGLAAGGALATAATPVGAAAVS
jgi:hypothetical protein